MHHTVSQACGKNGERGLEPVSAPTTLVSVIMPAHNAAEFIEEAIDSVLAQSYENWELLLIDDASTDKTAQVVKPYLEDARIHLLAFQENQGVSGARNAGLQKARGQLVAFLDADDKWLPEKLQQQVAFHESHPEVALSFTRFAHFDKAGECCHAPKMAYQRDLAHVDVSRLYYENIIGTLTVMLRQDVLGKVGCFDTDLRLAEDHDLWLRVLQAGYRFGYLNEKLAMYRLSAQGLTKSLAMYKAQRRKFLKKHFDSVFQSALSRKAWGGYYRHFGNEYDKRKAPALARRYYARAMSCYGLGFAGLRMCYFYLRSLIKWVVVR